MATTMSGNKKLSVKIHLSPFWGVQCSLLVCGRLNSWNYTSVILYPFQTLLCNKCHLRTFHKKSSFVSWTLFGICIANLLCILQNSLQWILGLLYFSRKFFVILLQYTCIFVILLQYTCIFWLLFALSACVIDKNWYVIFLFYQFISYQVTFCVCSFIIFLWH